MTSTNINVGIEGRSSSRILKPPGGGHSDIFGVREEKFESVARTTKMSQKSSISECFIFQSPPISKQEVMKNNEVVVKPEMEKENGEKIDEELKNGNSIKNEEVKSKEPVVLPTPQRVRVPPGGFSSGLW